MFFSPRCQFLVLCLLLGNVIQKHKTGNFICLVSQGVSEWSIYCKDMHLIVFISLKSFEDRHYKLSFKFSLPYPNILNLWLMPEITGKFRQRVPFSRENQMWPNVLSWVIYYFSTEVFLISKNHLLGYFNSL